MKNSSTSQEAPIEFSSIMRKDCYYIETEILCNVILENHLQDKAILVGCYADDLLGNIGVVGRTIKYAPMAKRGEPTERIIAPKRGNKSQTMGCYCCSDSLLHFSCYAGYCLCDSLATETELREKLGDRLSQMQLDYTITYDITEVINTLFYTEPLGNIQTIKTGKFTGIRVQTIYPDSSTPLEQALAYIKELDSYALTYKFEADYIQQHYILPFILKYAIKYNTINLSRIKLCNISRGMPTNEILNNSTVKQLLDDSLSIAKDLITKHKNTTKHRAYTEMLIVVHSKQEIIRDETDLSISCKTTVNITDYISGKSVSLTDKGLHFNIAELLNLPHPPAYESQMQILSLYGEIVKETPNKIVVKPAYYTKTECRQLVK